MSNWVNCAFEELWWDTIRSGGTSIPQALDSSIDFSTDGSSIGTEVSTGVDATSLSSSFDSTPGWWFNADMKCSRQRSIVSFSERHG